MDKFWITVFLFIGTFLNNGYGISVNEFYSYIHDDISDVLPQGDEKYAFVKLTTPVHLYSEKYDLVYINTNGILTFGMEASSFMNLPFPLEHASIAPFYANIDTSDSDSSTAIVYFQSQNPELLQNVTDTIRHSFSEADDFVATSVFIATWENVGCFDRKSDKRNSFQVAIICSDEQTYVQFLYPHDGINWIQAEMGASGLPDVRAQVGFTSEDGRYFNVNGSGTENVRHLADKSNYGEAGLWLYRIGPVGYEDSLEEPDLVHYNEQSHPRSCDDGGRYKCHTYAKCTDTSTGYCCKCLENYFGNGYSCIKNDIPIRVAGDIKGTIGNEEIQAQIQSYVVLLDGRSYTAITSMNQNIGFQAQLLSVLGESIGWLFAKPVENGINGYQITGGKFNHSSILIFRNGERFYVNQRFNGLNLYDQLSVDIEVEGDLPHIPYGAKIQMSDIIIEHEMYNPTSIRHISTRNVVLNDDQQMVFTVEETVSFEKCSYADSVYETIDPKHITEKISKISLNYDPRENALRVGMLNKVGDADKFDPCTSHNCGENTFCVSNAEEDTYECQCKPGYTQSHEEEELIHCVDIDECYGSNVCDPNSECINIPGGYNCHCLEGFEGNGYVCNRLPETENIPLPPPLPSPHYSTVNPIEEDIDLSLFPNNEFYENEDRPSYPLHGDHDNHDRGDYEHPHESDHRYDNKNDNRYDPHESDHRYGNENDNRYDPSHDNRHHEYDNRHDDASHENHRHEHDDRYDDNHHHEDHGDDHHHYEDHDLNHQREYDHTNNHQHENNNRQHEYNHNVNNHEHNYESVHYPPHETEHHDHEYSNNNYGQYDHNNRRGYETTNPPTRPTYGTHTENRIQPAYDPRYSHHDNPHEQTYPLTNEHSYPYENRESNYQINHYPQEYPATRFGHSETSSNDPLDDCHDCSKFANCLDGYCECRDGWHGDGMTCEYNCEANMMWDGDTCVPEGESEEEEEVSPFCSTSGCTCPTGYSLVEFAFGQTCRIARWDTSQYNHTEVHIPCNEGSECGPYASCQFTEHQYICVCNPGFVGNGHDCEEREISCLDEDICNEHASCQYDISLGKSVCKCDKNYEGDGTICQYTESPECVTSDDCGIHSLCDRGICICQSGYERDVSDFCVPAGLCGGTFCSENAICKFDEHESVQYCHCPEGFLGDGVLSCKSIPPQCNIRNNCGLYAICMQNYRDTDKFECVCSQGYYGDGFVCTPEENCLNKPTLCHPNAKCESTPSGLKCICDEGFLGNGTNCSEVPRLDSGFLLISQGVAIVRVPFDGKIGRPVAMSQMAIGLDKDCATGRFYWSDITTKSIWSANYDGTDKKAFIIEDLLSPEGITVDWISRRLYWTDSTKDTIEVADLDNSTRRAVIINKHLVNPRGIAVDPIQNKIYWSDWNRDAPKIEWANLDGTERETLLTGPEVQLPNSLAVKQQSSELCFADAGTKKVECLRPKSKMVRTIASNLSYPFGLAVSEDHYYWTDWTTNKIESVDIYGTRKPGLTGPLFKSHKMYGMTATTESCLYNHVYTQCLHNGGCPSNRICLNNYNAPSGRSCKCITGINCNDVNNNYMIDIEH